MDWKQLVETGMGWAVLALFLWLVFGYPGVH